MPILSSLPSYGWLERVTRSLIAAAALLGAPVWSQAADLVALSADRVNATLEQDTILGARYWWPSNGHIWWALALWALGASWIWLRDPKRRKQAIERAARLIEWFPSLRKKYPPEEEFLESDMPLNSFSHIEWPIGNPDSDSVSSINSQWETDPMAEYDIHREYWQPIQALGIFANYMNSSNHPDVNMIKKIQEILTRDQTDDESEEVITLRRDLLIRISELLWAERHSSIDGEMTTPFLASTKSFLPWAQNASWVNRPESTIIPDGTRDWAEHYWDGLPFDWIAMDDLVRRYWNQDIWSREESLIEECLKHSSKPLEECILLVLLQPFRVRQDALQERFQKVLRTIVQGVPEDTIDFIIFLLENKEQLWWIENLAYAACVKKFNLTSFKEWWQNDQATTEKRSWMIGTLRNLFARISRRKWGAWGSTAWQGSENNTGGSTGPETTTEVIDTLRDSWSPSKWGGGA